RAERKVLLHTKVSHQRPLPTIPRITMKRPLSLIAVCAFAVSLAGCGKKAAQSAATELEKAFPSVATTAAPAVAPAAAQAPVLQEIAKAVTAIRQQAYDQAFFTLRSA